MAVAKLRCKAAYKKHYQIKLYQYSMLFALYQMLRQYYNSIIPRQRLNPGC